MDKGCDPEVFQELLSANADISKRYSFISAPDLMEAIEQRSQRSGKDSFCFLPDMGMASSQVKQRISELVASHYAARIMSMQMPAAAGNRPVRRL